MLSTKIRRKRFAARPAAGVQNRFSRWALGVRRTLLPDCQSQGRRHRLRPDGPCECGELETGGFADRMDPRRRSKADRRYRFAVFDTRYWDGAAAVRSPGWRTTPVLPDVAELMEHTGRYRLRVIEASGCSSLDRDQPRVAGDSIYRNKGRLITCSEARRNYRIDLR
jgi:hypothetical protein